MSTERDYERESLKILLWNMIFDCPPQDAPSEHAGDYADAILAAGYRKPRVVTTADELDALPVGSVVRSSAGTIACKCEATRGVVFGDDRSFPWLKLATPATVLHEPEEGQ